LETVREGLWRTRLEDEVRRQADVVAETFSSASDGIFILDGGVPPKIVECNETASAIFGYEREEMVGSSVTLLHVSRDSMREFQVLVGTALGGASGPYCLPEFAMRRKSGSVFSVEHSVGQLFDQEGDRRGWVSIVRDISRDREEAELRMSEGARDAVTGLPNRMLFGDRLTVALRQAQRRRHRVAVMILEVDLGGTGHPGLEGRLQETLLRSVAEKLEGIVRGSDTVAHVGDNSFAILVSELGRVEGAGKLARRVLGGISDPYSVEGAELTVRGSIGIALYPDDSEDADGLVRRAHVAMYRAKQEGWGSFQDYALVSWQ
jgi:diguanylate cyclase (GGDEF)-like protein/PAS domain S-box-containing protein